MPYCKKCGSQVDADANFCTECGAAVGFRGANKEPAAPSVVEERPGESERQPAGSSNDSSAGGPSRVSDQRRASSRSASESAACLLGRGIRYAADALSETKRKAEDSAAHAVEVNAVQEESVPHAPNEDEDVTARSEPSGDALDRKKIVVIGAVAVTVVLLVSMRLLGGVNEGSASTEQPAAEPEKVLESEPEPEPKSDAKKEKEEEEIKWPTSGLASMLPTPEKKIREISESEKQFSATIEDVSSDEFRAYATTCRKEGFNIGAVQEESSLTAKHSANVKLKLEHDDKKRLLIIRLTDMIVDFELVIEKSSVSADASYALAIYVDEERVSRVSNDGSEELVVKLLPGTHNLRIESADDSSVNASCTFKVAKDRKRLSVRSYCHVGNLCIAKVKKDGSSILQDGDVAMPMNSWSPTGDNYQETVDSFVAAGFTNVAVTPDYSLTPGIFGGLPEEGKTTDVLAGGEESFEKGSIYKPDTPIVVSFGMWEINDPSLVIPAYESTYMLDELESNALRAKETFSDQYVVVSGPLGDMDASGEYFSINRAGDQWGFISISCDVKSEDVKSSRMNYSKGDWISVKGKVGVVGEIMGFNIDANQLL